MFCNYNKNMFVCYTSRHVTSPTSYLAGDPRWQDLTSSRPSVVQPTCPVSCRATNMNINAWLTLTGISVLFWLLPVETVETVETSPQLELDHQHVMRQVQLALGQFQAFKEAKTYEDISFSTRVNRKSHRHCFVDNI